MPLDMTRSRSHDGLFHPPPSVSGLDFIWVCAAGQRRRDSCLAERIASKTLAPLSQVPGRLGKRPGYGGRRAGCADADEGKAARPGVFVLAAKDI